MCFYKPLDDGREGEKGEGWMPTTYFLLKNSCETSFVSNPTAVLVSVSGPSLPSVTPRLLDLSFSNHRNVDASATSATHAATNATATTTTTGPSHASGH